MKKSFRIPRLTVALFLLGTIAPISLPAQPAAPAPAAQPVGFPAPLGFFQPAPVVDQPKRDFSVPAVAVPPQPDFPGSIWDSDTSKSLCGDDNYGTAANAVGISLGPDCNQYKKPMEAGTGPYADLPVGQSLSPHQLILAPALYWPLCTLDIEVDPGNPSNLLSLGWNGDPDLPEHGFVYAGCYGWNEPVSPGVTQNSPYKMSNVFLSNSSSDWLQDGEDDWTPFDVPDPANQVFPVDHPNLPDTDVLPISLMTGRFFSDPTDSTWSKAENLFSSFLESLGLVSRDIAVLGRTAAGGGKVYFINSTIGADPVCAESAVYGTCPTCSPSGPYNEGTCQACLSNVSNAATIQSALADCHKTYNYPDNYITAGFNLEGTDDPVHIMGYPRMTYYSRNPNSLSPFYGSRSTISADASSAVVSDSTLNSVKWTRMDSSFTNPADADAEPAADAAAPNPEVANAYARASLNQAELDYSGIIGRLTRDVFMVLNRGPEKCFNEFIRFRNPKHAVDGTITSTTVTDTDGIPLKQGNGPLGDGVLMPGEAGADRCGYYTFYMVTLNAAGKPESVDVVKDKVTGAIVKLPAGHNPIYGATGDFNGDGILDLITANTGSQAEDANGSVTVAFCLDTNNALPLPTDPATGKPTQFPVCRTGFILQDVPVQSTLGVQPFEMTAGVFKGHTIKNVPAAADGIFPADACLTFLDGSESSKGNFACLINKIDAISSVAGYKYYNKVDFDIKYDYTTNAADMPTPVGHARKRVTGRSYWPLGITHGLFALESYNRHMMGMDVFMANLASEVFFPGYQGSFTLSSGGTVGSQSYQVGCNSLLVGLNNSGVAGWWRNNIDSKTVTITQEINKDDPATPDVNESVSVVFTGFPCTGTFATPKSLKTDFPDTTTPKYHEWGGKFLTRGMLTSATERSYRGTDIMYKEPGTYVIDLQLNATPGFAAVNGAPLKIPETSIFGAGASSAYVLPNDNCSDVHEFEMTSMVKDTRDVGVKPGCLPDPATGEIDNDDCEEMLNPGPDPTTWHRCRQRFGVNQVNHAICCLVLEHPEIGAAYQGNEIVLPPDCPGDDPFECCVTQVAGKGVGVLWSADGNASLTGVPPIPDYNPTSPACECEDQEAAYHAAVAPCTDGDPTTACDLTAAAEALKEWECCQNYDPTVCEPPPGTPPPGTPPPGTPPPGTPPPGTPPPGTPPPGTPPPGTPPPGTPPPGTPPPGTPPPGTPPPGTPPPGTPPPGGWENCTLIDSGGGDITINVAECAVFQMCCQCIGDGTCNSSTVSQCLAMENPCAPPTTDDLCKAEDLEKGDIPSWCNPACKDLPEPKPADCIPPDTTPSGDLEPGKLICEPLNPGNVINGKLIAWNPDQTATAVVVRYKPKDPLTALDTVKVIQTGGLVAQPHGTTLPEYGSPLSGEFALITKAMTAGTAEIREVLDLPVPKVLIGQEYVGDVTVALMINDKKIGDATCGAAAEVMGGGEGGCGCDMKSARPDHPLANLVLGLIGLIPLSLMLGLRKRVGAR